jgi:hypothetical protein
MPPLPVRLLALAQIFDGGSRSDAARVGSVDAKGPEGLKDGKARHRANHPWRRADVIAASDFHKRFLARAA